MIRISSNSIQPLTITYDPYVGIFDETFRIHLEWVFDLFGHYLIIIDANQLLSLLEKVNLLTCYLKMLENVDF